MKVLTPEQLEEKLLERYNDHPLGWKCFWTCDKKGNYGIGWVNRKIGEQYWVKLSSPYGQHGLGFICTFNEEFPFLNEPGFDKDYGIRSFHITSEEREKMFKNGRMISSVLRKMGEARRKPPESDDITKPRIMGPYPNRIITCLEDISPSQEELEIKMQRTMERFNKSQLVYIG